MGWTRIGWLFVTRLSAATLCSSGGAGRDHDYVGFAVNVGETWAVVNVIDNEFVAFDGYLAVRSDSFIDVEVVTEEDTFVLAALELRAELPSDPVLPLGDHRSPCRL